MSFYDDASLVVIPSAQKTSKLYAVKPTDGSGDLTFTRTGDTATRVNSAGLIEPVLANVPRLDYLGSTCPRLLLEPQRTNAFTYSEQFDNAAWTKYQATISANTAVSPDGNVNADKLIDSTANDIHAVYRGYTFSANSTISFFVKAAEYSRIGIANLSDGGDVIFNLTTASVVSTSANFTNGKIESYGNGWYRISATTNGTSGAKAVGLYLVNNAGATTFTGTGTSGILIFGAQLEDSAAYATSYIPCLAASATRGADACSKTGISSLIGQTEGTIFFEYTRLNNSGDDIPIGLNGSGGKFIWFRQGGVQFYGNGGTLIFSPGAATTQGGTYKVAFVYGQSDFRLYINGALISALTSGTFTGSFDDVYFFPIIAEPYSAANATKQLLLFKTKLTNAELAELTTL